PTDTQFNGILSKTPEEMAMSNKIENKYFIKIGDKEYGPFSSSEIIKSIKRGKPIDGYKKLKVTLDSVIRPTNSPSAQLVKDNKLLLLKLQQTSSNTAKTVKNVVKKPSIIPIPRKLPKKR
ncbi:MAG TPA: hypothetical protein VNX68_01530, partial [Nitrosopumilaceae archaeon]|nr:hypothetical protein [Nitrosopumilaceae archaeon]